MRFSMECEFTYTPYYYMLLLVLVYCILNLVLFGSDWSLVENRELEAPWLPYIAPIPKQTRPIFAGYRELQNPSWGVEERDEGFTWYSPYARLRHVSPLQYGDRASKASKVRVAGKRKGSGSGSPRSSNSSSGFDSVRWKSWIRGIFCSNEGNGKSTRRRRRRV